MAFAVFTANPKGFIGRRKIAFMPWATYSSTSASGCARVALVTVGRASTRYTMSSFPFSLYAWLIRAIHFVVSSYELPSGNTRFSLCRAAGPSRDVDTWILFLIMKSSFSSSMRLRLLTRENITYFPVSCISSLARSTT